MAPASPSGAAQYQPSPAPTPVGRIGDSRQESGDIARRPAFDGLKREELVARRPGGRERIARGSERRVGPEQRQGGHGARLAVLQAVVEAGGDRRPGVRGVAGQAGSLGGAAFGLVAEEGGDGRRRRRP